MPAKSQKPLLAAVQQAASHDHQFLHHWSQPTTFGRVRRWLYPILTKAMIRLVVENFSKGSRSWSRSILNSLWNS
jgi:hypothetical protein